MDLRQLNSIEIDTAAETMTVGGGVITGEVLDPLFEAGFEIRKCPCRDLQGECAGPDLTELW